MNYKGLLYLLIFTLLSFSNFKSEGQSFKRLDYAIGAGFPDFYHTGIRWTISSGNRFGFYYGTVFNKKPGEKVFSIMVDHETHFKNQSLYSARKVWYIRKGFDFIMGNNNYRRDFFAFLTLTGGRDFYLSERFGASVDAGLFVRLEHSTESKIGHFIDYVDYKPTPDMNYKIFPAVRAQLFYSFDPVIKRGRK